jgi:predicted ester cyclase
VADARDAANRGWGSYSWPAGSREGGMAGASELLDALVDTFNQSQWDEAERLWATNGVEEEIGTGRTLNVKEGTENAKAWRAAFPDARGVVENRIVSGSQAAGEILWTGTQRGPLTGPAGTLPPTGKAVRVRAVMVVSEEGGKLVRLRHYIDIAGMMAQLGVTQPAG